MNRHKKIWRLVAKALGEKASPHDHEADTVASIRAFIVLCYLITNAFIVIGIIHHW